MRRLLFIVPVGAQAIANVLSIPVLITKIGPIEWGSVASAQGVGGLLAVLVSLGWFILGPALLQRPREQGTDSWGLLHLSCRLKAIAACAVVPASWVVAVAITGEWSAMVVASVTSTVSLGLSQYWFFAAEDRPGLLVLFETLPKVLVTGVAWVLVYLDLLRPAQGMAAQAGGVIASFVLVYILAGRSTARRVPYSRQSTVAWMRRQAAGVLTQLPSAVFSYSPLIIVTIAAPALLGSFGMYDKIIKLYATGLSAVVGIVIASVFHGGRESDARSLVIRQSALSGVVFLFSLASVPFVIDLLSVGAVGYGLVDVLLMAAIIAMNFVVVLWPAVVLAPLRRMRRASLASSLGCALGIPLVWWLSHWCGASGGLVAVAVSYFLTASAFVVIGLQKS